jgi:hypothetical protein
MPEFTDIIRDGIRGLQVAFDKQWASFCGLMSSQRAGRIVWATNGPLELEGVERMSLGAAAVLARHDHDLRLPSLRELSPELARLLAQHRRRLYLDGLRSLDAVTAKALAAHGLETVRRSWRESLEALKTIEEMPSPGDPGWEPEHELELTDALFLDVGMLAMLTLSLSGLRRLSPSAARGLGQHKGVLILDGLKEISDEAAEELGNHFGSLELNGLRSLSGRGLLGARCQAPRKGHRVIRCGTDREPRGRPEGEAAPRKTHCRRAGGVAGAGGARNSGPRRGPAARADRRGDRDRLPLGPHADHRGTRPGCRGRHRGPRRPR